MQTLFSRWAPPSERSKLPAFAYAGTVTVSLQRKSEDALAYCSQKIYLFRLFCWNTCSFYIIRNFGWFRFHGRLAFRLLRFRWVYANFPVEQQATRYFVYPGIFACVWFVFWVLLVSSTPEEHRWISRGEQTYIVKNLEAQAGGTSVRFWLFKSRRIFALFFTFYRGQDLAMYLGRIF